MPELNHYNDLKKGYKPYEYTAYRYRTDLPVKEFVNWNISKVIWMILIVVIVISIILFSSPYPLLTH